GPEQPLHAGSRPARSRHLHLHRKRDRGEGQDGRPLRQARVSGPDRRAPRARRRLGGRDRTGADPRRLPRRARHGRAESRRAAARGAPARRWARGRRPRHDEAMTRRRVLIVVAGLLAVLALEQLGQGAWIHLRARLAQHLLQRAWARTARGETRARPWPWADTWPVARLRVPAHDVDLIVLSGVSGRTLAFGPGHAPASAAPGAPGTAIITGHRDTHFRFLEHMKPGDELLVELPGGRPTRLRIE